MNLSKAERDIGVETIKGNSFSEEESKTSKLVRNSTTHKFQCWPIHLLPSVFSILPSFVFFFFFCVCVSASHKFKNYCFLKFFIFHKSSKNSRALKELSLLDKTCISFVIVVVFVFILLFLFSFGSSIKLEFELVLGETYNFNMLFIVKKVVYCMTDFCLRKSTDCGAFHDMNDCEVALMSICQNILEYYIIIIIIINTPL